jgi:hypothetical protein
MLPDALIAEYADKFFGFGAWDAKIWFVGMEEGGGWNETDVQRRLDAWDRSNKCELEDAPSFCPASGITRWHGMGARLQETWEQLIRMLLIARNMPDTNESVLNYQMQCLGRKNGETCLIELLPLPSPNVNEWRYAKWSNMFWLKNRETYYTRLLVNRAFYISRKIESHRPAVVVFYGSSFHRIWGCVAGAEWAQAIPNKLMGCTKGNIAFFVTKHPVDPKLGDNRDDYFREIGRFFSREYETRFK